MPIDAILDTGLGILSGGRRDGVGSPEPEAGDGDDGAGRYEDCRCDGEGGVFCG